MISRRKLLAGAGATLVSQRLGSAIGRAQGAAITIAGQPIEILITPISVLTTRVSLVPAGGSPTISGDGSLVDRGWPAPAARIATLERERGIKSGDLTVVARGFQPRDRGPARAALQVLAPGYRVVQNFSIDARTGALTFPLGDGPLFGLGEGGPQFDRRGSAIGPRSGQGGYQLRTHGGRVPVQWLIGASGWALFIHQPYGTFDLTGPDGIFKVSDTADAAVTLPLDFFVVGAREPAAMIQQLHDDHFKVVLHIVVEARTLTGTVGDRCDAVPLPSGRTPDGRWPDNRVVSCYWPVHKQLVDVGVDGWWPDQGDGLNPASRLARNRMYGTACGSGVPTNGRSRCIATAAPACSGTRRFSGPETCTPPGRR